MPKVYTYNDTQYSEDDVFQAASESNMSLEEYIKKSGLKVSDEEVEEKITTDDQTFQTDPAKETASVGSETTAVDMDSALVDTSLELQDPDPNDFIIIDDRKTVYRHEYAQYLKDNPDNPDIPATFEEYAKALKLDIFPPSQPEVPVTQELREINIPKEYTQNPKELKKQLNKEGFVVSYEGGRAVSAGTGAPGVYNPLKTTITAANGEEFIFDQSMALVSDNLYSEINAFLNANRPTDGYAKKFIQKHDLANNDFKEGLINGVVQKPDYKLLQGVSNGIDKVMDIYNGKKDIKIGDLNLSYNDFFTPSEDTLGVAQDAYRTAVINTTIKYLEKNNYIDSSTDLDYVRDIVSEVVLKNNYFENYLQKLKLQDQADQQLALGSVRITEEERKQFKDNIVDSEDNENLKLRYSFSNEVDRLNEEIIQRQSTLEGTSDPDVRKNLQNTINILLGQRQEAFVKLKGLKPSTNILASKIVYSTFTDAEGKQTTEPLTQEQLEKLLEQNKDSLFDEASTFAALYGYNMRETLGMMYDDTIKEYMYLDGWSRENKVNLKYRSAREKSGFESDLKEFLGVEKAPQELTLYDYIGFKNYQKDKYGVEQQSITDEGSNVDLYRKHRQSLDLKRSALDDLYLYNIDPADIKDNVLTMGFESALVAFAGEEKAADIKLGLGFGRTRLDNMQQFFNQYTEVYADEIKLGILPGISLNEKQVEALQRDWLDEAVEATGGMVPLLAEFAILNYATGGALALTGGAKILANLKKSKNIYDKVRYYGVETILEELKFQAIEDKDVSFQGASFYGVNQLFKVVPGLEGKKSFFNAWIRNTFGTGISGATAANVSGLIGEYKKSIFNDGNFNKYLEDTFGEDANFIRKFSIEAASFAAFGIPSLRSENFSWKQYQKNTFDLMDSMRKAEFSLEYLKRYEPNNKEAIETTQSILIDLQRYSAARTGDYQFNKENPNVEANVGTYVNKSLSKIVSASKEPVIVKFVEKQSEMVGSNDVSDKAFFNTGENTMYFIKNKFNQGVMLHEINHAGIKKYLDLNPGQQAVFNKNILKGLEKSLGAKGQELKDKIKKEYGLDMRFNADKNGLGEEFTSFVYEFLNTQNFANKFSENEANQSIWGYVTSEVKSLLERSGLKSNVDAENVFSVMQRISDSALEGKDISRQVAMMVESITTGDIVAARNKQAGKSSRDLMEEQRLEVERQENIIERASEDLSNGVIDVEAYESIVDAADAAIEVAYKPVAQPTPLEPVKSSGLTQQQMNARVDDLVGTKDKSGNYVWQSKEQWQQSQQFKNAYDKIIIGNLLDPLIKKGIEGESIYGISTEDFILQVKDKVSDLLINFDPTKNNSLIGYINSQLNWRKGDVSNRQKAINAYETKNYEKEALENLADTGSEYSYSGPATKSQGIKPNTLMPKSQGVDHASEAVAEVQAAANNIKIDDLSFGTTPGLANKTVAKFFGIPVNKLAPNENLTLENTYTLRNRETGEQIYKIDSSGEKNYIYTERELDKAFKQNPNAIKTLETTAEIKSVLLGIQRLGPKLLELFPQLNVASQVIKGEPAPGETAVKVEGGTLTNQGIAAEKGIQGSTSNLPRKLMDILYEPLMKQDGKQARASNPKSQTPVRKLKDISYEEFAVVLNQLKDLNYEKPDNMSSSDWLAYRREVAQVLKGVVTWYNKVTTNEILRRDDTLAQQTRANLEAGKPAGMASKDIELPSVTREKLKGIIEKTKEKYSSEDDVFVSSFEQKIEDIVDRGLNADEAIYELLDFSNKYFPAEKFKVFTQSIQPLIYNMYDGKISESDVLQIFERFRKVHRYEEQKAGYNITKKDLYKRLELTSNNVQAQELLINEWLRNISRGARNLGLDGTKNENIYTNVIKPLEVTYPELKGKYTVIDNGKEGKERRSWIANNGVIQRTYNNINYIKSNFAGLKDATAAEALEAKEYIWREIDSKLKAGDTFEARTLLSSWLIDQRGPMRKLAQLGFMQKNIEGKSILEHQTPVKDVYEALYNYIENPTQANRDAANVLIDGSRVNLISKGLDALLPKLGENRYETPEFKAEIDRLNAEGQIYYTEQTPQGNASKDISLTKQVSERLDTFGKLPIDLSAQQAKAIGKEVDSGLPNWMKLKIDPEAQDFLGLMQSMVPAGKEGDRVQADHKRLFTDPFNRAYNQLDADKVYISSNYKSLRKSLKISHARLKEKVGDTYYTNSDAVRVFYWTKQDLEIPGITKREKANLIEHVRANKDLLQFAMQTNRLNRGFGLGQPSENWIAGSIQGDLISAIEKINRPAYLRQWQANVDAYFTEGNLNKMEALYGSRWRKSMLNSLERQKTGKNRYYSSDSQVGKFSDQLSGAVLNTLNLNNKSAFLQLTSATNFIDWKDNNPVAAGKAFANQKQYWSDVRFLLMSDFLKERRAGLNIDINDADVADLATKGGFTGLTAKLLKLGLTPTVIADNIAIAGGGATFYRNKVSRYLKDGLSQVEAQKKAFEDFREKAEVSQQSNRPDKISMQQAGPLGRIVLAYTNTPQQYLRLTNKALNDIKNGRGDFNENVSKIAYYQFMQNMIFTALQQGVQGVLFDDDEVEIQEIKSEEEYKNYLASLDPSKRAEAVRARKEEVKLYDEAVKENKKKTSGLLNTANGMIDTGLKGMGLTGSVISTFKNAAFRAYLEGNKDNPDYAGTIPVSLLGISPGLSTKFGQMKRGISTLQYSQEEIRGRGLADINNPMYSGIADVTASLTNLPVNRLFTKATNVKNFYNEELSLTQRILSLGGWSPYALGIEKEEWSAYTPEELQALQDWKKEQFSKLDPYQRTLYLKWQKEQKQRMKEKNKNK